MMAQVKFVLGSVVLVSVAVLWQVAVGDDTPPKPENGARRDASELAKDRQRGTNDRKASENESGKTNEQSATRSDDADARLPPDDLQALFMTAATFVKAYNDGDSQTIANLFSQDAEYIDEQGYRFHGRTAIGRSIDACLAAHKGAQIELRIHSIRQVAPGAAIEDGTTTVTFDKLSDGSIETNYCAVHMKIDGKWQTISVRETAPQRHNENRTQLRQLSWMLGDWVDEGEDTLVASSCKPIQGGNFLLREFKLHVGGKAVISGEQRIGWDAATGKFKSWVFDSDGAYSEGYWESDDNRWTLRSVGIAKDGQQATCTTIYTIVDKNTVTWQTVDHEVAGTKIPDSEVITIVRRAPLPSHEEDKLTSQQR